MCFSKFWSTAKIKFYFYLLIKLSKYVIIPTSGIIYLYIIQRFYRISVVKQTSKVRVV